MNVPPASASVCERSEGMVVLATKVFPGFLRCESTLPGPRGDGSSRVCVRGATRGRARPTRAERFCASGGVCYAPFLQTTFAFLQTSRSGGEAVPGAGFASRAVLTSSTRSCQHRAPSGAITPAPSQLRPAARRTQRAPLPGCVHQGLSSTRLC